MIRPRALAAAAALVLLLLAGRLRAQEPPSAPSTPGEAAARAAEQAFADAFAAHDREAFAASVHPDAVFMGPTGPLRGREAVMEVWGPMVQSPTAPFTWRPERVIANPDGTLAMTTGPVFDPAGTWVGTFVSTWQRQADGRWQVVFDMAPRCAPARPAPDASGEAPAAEPEG